MWLEFCSCNSISYCAFATVAMKPTRKRVLICAAVVCLPTISFLARQIGIDYQHSQRDFATISESAPVPACKRKLVLHVGLHKTGTTSLQVWMMQHTKWLADEFGIHVGEPNIGAHCIPLTFHSFEAPWMMDARWQYCNQSSFDEIMNLTLASLANASSPVILSSEEFSNLQDTGGPWYLVFFGLNITLCSKSQCHTSQRYRLERCFQTDNYKQHCKPCLSTRQTR